MKKSVITTNGSLDILEYLLNNKDSKIHATDLKCVITNYQRVSDILDILESRELISIDLITEGKSVRSKCISLTRKGEIIAKQMIDLNNQIEEGF